MSAWLPRFATGSPPPLAFEDLVLLGDCYYLPYGAGPEAENLFSQARDLLARDPRSWGEDALRFRQLAARLRHLCARLAELRDRPLFHALGRRVWELREEMDLLEKYVGLKLAHPDPDVPCGSDFHLPETYRGGLVARLRELLVQRPNGDFVPAHRRPSP
jgi:hypothetical protein